MASIFLGACAARYHGLMAPGWLLLTILGIFFIEVAKNASGEVIDFDSGADLAVAPQDRSPFSGGKRVLVDGLLTRAQVIRISALTYLAGAALGFYIVFQKEPEVLLIGLVGLACAYLYHGPPFQLAYRGLGELVVAICYGPLICAGTYLVQRGRIPLPVILLGVPLGLLIGAFLWINEFPDYHADKSAAKRNWVVRLGRPLASRFFALILATAFVVLLFLPGVGWPNSVWLGFIALVPAVRAARQLLRHPETTALIVPAQAATLLSFVLLALGMGAGLLLATGQ